MMFIIGFLALAAVVAGSSVFYFNRKDNQVKTTTESPKETINYAPTSPVEQKETDDRKDEIVKEQTSQSNSSSSGKKTVVPTITNADSQSVNSYVMGIFEEDGTCTATFSKNDETKTKTSVGFGNVSYTQCAPMDLENGFLSAGTWKLIVSYSSAKAQGASDSREVVIK